MPSPHGTNNRYVSSSTKCRCDACRAAHRVYRHQRRLKAYAYTEANGLPSSVEHGVSAYENWGCRCDVCSAADHAKSLARWSR